MSLGSLPAALSFILEGTRGLRIFDYGDENVFRDLWLNALESDHPSINGENSEMSAPEQQILIIGNDPPSDAFAHLPESLRGINFCSHFTATSWLAAWKVKFPKAKAAIAVIDHRETDLATGTACGLQTILGARNPSAQAIIPRATVQNAPSLTSICQWLHDSAKDTSRETAPHHRELLKTTIWNALTSDRERHHAISNVLGASLLAEEVGGKTSVPVQPFLRALVEACGIRAKSPGGQESWMPAQLQYKLPAAALIDDMSDLWSDFVQGALGRSVPLRTCEKGKFADEMKELPTRLTKALEDETRRTLDTSDLFPTPAGETATADFVLFLDLRLHLDDKFRAALSKVGWLLLQSERNLSWLEKGRERLESDLRRFADTTQPARPENPNDPEETLLPRLLSLIDPTLPIVIFSSTHSTDLSDPFRDYGNIITTFRKPVLSGLNASWAQMVKELRANFASAMEQASRIIETRRLIRGACDK